jgi:hypothetical protein
MELALISTAARRHNLCEEEGVTGWLSIAPSRSTRTRRRGHARRHATTRKRQTIPQDCTTIERPRRARSVACCGRGDFGPTPSSLKLNPAHPSRNPQARLSVRGRLGTPPRIIRRRSSGRSEKEVLSTVSFTRRSAKSFKHSTACHTIYRIGFSRF